MAQKTEGKYLTKGRGLELERLITDEVHRLELRLADLELQVRSVNALARSAHGMPIEIARQQIGAMLTVIKQHTTTTGEEASSG